MDLTTDRSAARDRWMVTAAICLFVLTALGLATAAVTVIQYSNLATRSQAAADCQAKINGDFLVALRQRSEASDVDRRAIRTIAQSGSDMITVLLKPEATQDDRVKAISDWQKVQAEAEHDLSAAEQTRLNNPLPSPAQCS